MFCVFEVGEGVAGGPRDGHQHTSLLLMAHPLGEVGGQQLLHGGDALQVLLVWPRKSLRQGDGVPPAWSTRDTTSTKGVLSCSAGILVK